MPEVEIATIQVPVEWREINYDVVEQLKYSIKTVGQINPIVIRYGDNKLIAGMHRLLAARESGHKYIKVIYSDSDDLHQELVNIHENLLRASYTKAEYYHYIKREKQIYEELYPKDNKHGGKREKGVKSENKSATERIADSTGKSARTVRRDLQTADNLKVEITGLEFLDKSRLEKLSKLPETIQQRLVGYFKSNYYPNTAEEYDAALETLLEPEKISKPKKTEKSYVATINDLNNNYNNLIYLIKKYLPSEVKTLDNLYQNLLQEMEKQNEDEDL
jgi:ParB-like chromosome segregation protein Spo0J